MMRNLKAHLQSLCKSRRGAAAVEFALISPVFLLLFAGTAEIGLATMTRMQINEAVSAAVNRALVSGAPLTAASADTMASTLAAMLRRTRGGQNDGAKLTISFNGSRTYTYLDNQTKPTVAASSIDQCRCPTESEGVLRWGNQVSCGTACPDKSLSARYVEIDVTRPYTPLLPAMGLVGADGFRIHTLAVLQ